MKPPHLYPITVLLLCSLSCRAADLNFANEGLVVTTDTGISYTLSYPSLSGGDEDVSKQTQVDVTDAHSATVRYANGGSIEMNIGDAGVVTLRFSDLPVGTNRYIIKAPLPFSLVNGGKWRIGDVEGVFPMEKPAKPHLFQGNQTKFTLTGVDGGQFTITTPAYAYQQLTDNREWNWKQFSWMASMPYNPDWKTRELIIREDAEEDSPSTEGGVELSFTDKGVEVERSSTFSIVVEYPELKGGSKEECAIVQKEVGTGKATLAYGNGSKAVLTIEEGNKLGIEFRDVPSAIKAYQFTARLPFSLINGGKWEVGGTGGSFPAQMPENPHLYQGNANEFILTNIDGQQIRAAVPDHSYQEINDTRKWNWKQFWWKLNVNYNPNKKREYLTFSASSPSISPEKSSAIIDMFGQNMNADWPEKVHSVEELKADVETEKVFYAEFTPPDNLDKFGGLADAGPELGLKKTGYYHVEQKDGRWFLVDPLGNPFFHLGICSFLPYNFSKYKGYEKFYESLPPPNDEYKAAYVGGYNSGISFHRANMIRKYGAEPDDQEWFRRMVYRVKQFGFNSAGAFSGGLNGSPSDLDFPYVGALPNREWDGVPQVPGVRDTLDPFNPKTRTQLDKNFAEKIAPLANDAWLIGYFLTNEPYYEDVATVVPGLKASQSSAKVRLVQMLQDTYPTIKDFNRAWNQDFPDFEALGESGLPVLTKAAYADMQKYVEIFMRQYYGLQRELFKKYDPNHMLIGSRLTPRTANMQTMAEICGEYMDIVSINYYTNSIDADFLEKIYKWAKKPFILSEFYWGSTAESGLFGSNKEVDSQRDRGLAYRNYVEEASTLPFIVGVEWFTLVDYPLAGQSWGSFMSHNPNSGLIAVTDRPWKDALREMAKTNYSIYDVMLGKQEPYRFDNPLFQEKADMRQIAKFYQADGTIKIDGQLSDWPGIPPYRIPGTRLVQGISADESEGEVFLCWDSKYLYILTQVKDATPNENEFGEKDIWRGDGVEVFVGSEDLDTGGTLLFTDRQVLLSAGETQPGYYIANAPEQSEIPIAVVPTSSGDGYVIEAAIPWEALAISPKIGQKLRFDFAINNSVDGKIRKSQLMWNGRMQNSSDRTYWGEAQLVQ